MIIVEMPVPLRDVTHLKLLWIETRFLNEGEAALPSEITAAFQPGHMKTVEVEGEGDAEPTEAQVFEKDFDLPETVVRKIEDVDAFIAWCVSRGATPSTTYGTLFNQRDVMQWVGIQEYTSRGIKLPAALQ